MRNAYRPKRGTKRYALPSLRVTTTLAGTFRTRTTPSLAGAFVMFFCRTALALCAPSAPLAPCVWTKWKTSTESEGGEPPAEDLPYAVYAGITCLVTCHLLCSLAVLLRVPLCWRRKFYYINSKFLYDVVSRCSSCFPRRSLRLFQGRDVA